MEEKDRLLNDARKGERITSLLKQSGWQDIQQIFIEAYHNALTRLKEKEDAEARATIKFLEDLYSQIDQSMQIGKISLEKYQTKYLKH